MCVIKKEGGYLVVVGGFFVIVEKKIEDGYNAPTTMITITICRFFFEWCRDPFHEKGSNE
jgi:hypothetical protein